MHVTKSFTLALESYAREIRSTIVSELSDQSHFEDGEGPAPNEIGNLAAREVTMSTSAFDTPAWSGEVGAFILRNLETGQRLNATVATNLKSASACAQRDDTFTTWAHVVCSGGRYEVISSRQSFERLKALVDGFSSRRLQTISDTWLHARLWELLIPWDEQRAQYLKSLIKYRYAPSELPVLLRKAEPVHADGSPSTCDAPSSKRGSRT
jgi:hypothetical protein